MEDRTITSQFKYRPLDVELREIRILVLDPLLKSSNDSLSGEIKHVSLDDRDLDYEAISYCWGNPAPVKALRVNGAELWLPLNGEKALRRMALPDRKRVLWIDFACIDQSNLVERASQVTLMSDVFRGASRVLVYLEGEGGYAARAIRNIIVLKLEMDEELAQWGSLIHLIFHYCSNFSRHPKRIRSYIDEDALYSFYGEEWFRRVWVVQEVSLARKAICCCGTYSVDVDTVLQVSGWLGVRMIPTYTLDLVLLLNHVFRIYVFRSTYRKYGGIQISWILMQMGTFVASDNRDKVFGILGLLNCSQIPRALLPDYTKALQIVYQDAIRQSFSTTRPLGILMEISHRDEADLLQSCMPSWVPSFHLKPSLHDSNPLLLRGEPLGFVELATKLAEEEVHPKVLQLQGIVLCKIVQTLPTMYIVKKSSECLLQMVEALNELGFGTDCLGRMALLNFAKELKYYSQDGHLESLIEGEIPINLHRHSVLLSLGDLESSEILTPNHFTALQGLWSNRRPAVTDLGNLSCAPQLSKAGDLVVMVHGGEVPFVLRPYGEEYLMLGECFLDGYMHSQEHREEVNRKLMEGPSTMFNIR